MARIRVTSNMSALKAAAEVLAAAVRVTAGKFSREIPPAVRSYVAGTPGTAWVAAGRAGGKWGWTPITAWLFDEPHSGKVPKHPLFGNRNRWYYQPYRPYIEEGTEIGLDQAAKVYADLSIAKWCKEAGFK